MIISIIVAVAENNVIGNNNALIWHIPHDLKRFKAITMGHPVVMGRKTYESMGKPLPGRENIVISRQTGLSIQGCQIFPSLEKALSFLKDKEEIFIIGGGQIYEQALPLTNRIYLTRIHQSFAGDTYFPEIQMNKWEIIREETIPVTNEVPFSYSYIDLVRK
jgi:dihydrofolate reductase